MHCFNPANYVRCCRLSLQFAYPSIRLAVDCMVICGGTVVGHGSCNLYILANARLQWNGNGNAPATDDSKRKCCDPLTRRCPSQKQMKQTRKSEADDPRAARTHNLHSRNVAPYHLASGPCQLLETQSRTSGTRRGMDWWESWTRF